MTNIKAYLGGAEGKELKAFFLGKYNELKNISNVKECKDAKEQALELKAQKRAAEKLREILEIIMPITETEEVDKEKDNYYNL